MNDLPVEYLLNPLARVVRTDLNNNIQLDLYRDYLEKVVDTVREGLLVLNRELIIQFANYSFYNMFAVTPEETIGQYVYELGDGQWNIPDLHRLLDDVLPENEAFNNYEIAHEFLNIGQRVMQLNARRVDHVQLILLAIEDVTEKQQARMALEELNRSLEEQVEQRTKQVQQLASQLVAAEQKERGRISMILHDDLQQQLVSVLIQLSLLRNRVEGEVAVSELEEMMERVRGAITLTRNLSVELSPPVLEGKSMTEAIRWLATQMQQLYGLKVKLKAKDGFPILDRNRHILLYQVVRELLFNVVKHAEVSEVVVSIQQEEGAYRIDVVDEGAGFDMAQLLREGIPRGGQGLINAYDRLHLIGGRLEFESAPDQGTRGTVIMPVDNGREKKSSDTV